MSAISETQKEARESKTEVVKVQYSPVRYKNDYDVIFRPITTSRPFENVYANPSFTRTLFLIFDLESS